MCVYVRGEREGLCASVCLERGCARASRETMSHDPSRACMHACVLERGCAAIERECARIVQCVCISSISFIVISYYYICYLFIISLLRKHYFIWAYFIYSTRYSLIIFLRPTFIILFLFYYFYC